MSRWWDFRYRWQAKFENWWGLNVLAAWHTFGIAFDLLRGKRIIIDDDYPVSRGGFQYYRVTYSNRPLQTRAGRTKPTPKPSRSKK